MKRFDYNVIINKKNIKNLYIRVDNNLNVIVNVNKKIKDADIYKFIKDKEPWIKKRISDIKNINNDVVSLEGKIISVLGEKYYIKIVKEDFNRIDVISDKFILYTKEDDIKYQIKVINEYLNKAFYKVLNDDILDECIKIAGKEKIKCDFTLKVKFMKSRFGSYSAKTNTVCLNLCLIKYDREIIKSVLLHEICHIRHMNHQKYFYKTLYKMCPYYDTYSKVIKKDFKYIDTWFLV